MPGNAQAHQVVANTEKQPQPGTRTMVVPSCASTHMRTDKKPPGIRKTHSRQSQKRPDNFLKNVGFFYTFFVDF